MYHLIYTSSEKRLFSPPDLKKLLASARMRNREVGVTGILIYHDGVFLQALEGDEAEVLAIFSRIGKDERHTGITMLHRNATLGKRRLFGDWSMAFADPLGAAQVLKGFIDLKRGLNLAELDGKTAIEILEACSKSPTQISA